MKLGTLTILTGALLVSVHGCGGRTESPGDGTGGGSTGGAPGGGQGGAPYGGGYGGGPGGDGGMPMGGYGGGPIGGYGGMPGGGGGSNCGDCPAFKLGGLLPMPACCANGVDCGALVTTTLSQLVALNEGCYPLGQPGFLDSTCPGLYFTDPLTGTPANYDGCCRAQSGTCGAYVDLTSKSGPMLGCVDVGAGGAGPQKCGGAPGDCGTCVQTYCASELSICASNSGCMAIIQCANSCTDEACIDKCIQSYPSGWPPFKSFQTCITQKCALECN